MILTKVHVGLLWRHPLHPVLAWELHGMLHLHWRNIKSKPFSQISQFCSLFLNPEYISSFAAGGTVDTGDINLRMNH